MIKGLGTDIVSIKRIAETEQRLGERFAARILVPNELLQYQTHHNATAFLAKRFAAKEAAVKAMGTGIGRGISFQHFQIKNDELGAPQLILLGAAKAHCDVLGVRFVHVSLSDEQEYATATVILEG